MIHSIDGTEKATNTIIPVFADNPYAPGGITDDETAEYQYKNYLKYAAANLKIPDWTPGEFEYYGNPALDLGDVVTIIDKDGVTKTPFLITSEHWQFRGAQTLISAGAAENAVTNTAGGNTAVPPITAVVNTTKNISAANIESTGETSGIIAASCFDVREMTTVFFEVNLELQNKFDFSVSLVIDGIPLITHNYSTTSAVHFSSYKILESGRHTAEITVSGTSGNVCNTSYLWGQNISGSAVKPDTGGENQIKKADYKPVFAVCVCDTTLTKTVKAALISFDDYFMEV